MVFVNVYIHFRKWGPFPEPSSYGSRSGKSSGSLRIRIHNTASNNEKYIKYRHCECDEFNRTTCAAIKCHIRGSVVDTNLFVSNQDLNFQSVLKSDFLTCWMIFVDLTLIPSPTRSFVAMRIRIRMHNTNHGDNNCYLGFCGCPGQDSDCMEDTLVTQVTSVHTYIVPQLLTRKYDLYLLL
jgi:hypothetical protein